MRAILGVHLFGAHRSASNFAPSKIVRTKKSPLFAD